MSNAAAASVAICHNLIFLQQRFQAKADEAKARAYAANDERS
jgi:hypothetical protein